MVHVVHFHDLTYLYPEYAYSGYIRNTHWNYYAKKVNEHLSLNKNQYNDGDILFLGSTYESRQYYGFARVIKNNEIHFENGFESIEEVFLPDLFYGDAIEELDIFYIKYSSKIFYCDTTFKECHSIIIRELKEKGQM